MNTTDESKLPSQPVTFFVWSSKKHVILYYHDARLCIFCWLIPDAFHYAAFSWWNWALLVGIHHLVFQKELMIEDSLPNSIIYTTSPLMKTGFCCGWWWFICRPHRLFHPFHLIVQYPLCVACHNLFQNWNIFLLYLSEEWHVEIWSSKCSFFFSA